MIDLILPRSKGSDETRKDFIVAKVQACAWTSVVLSARGPELNVQHTWQGDKHQISLDGPNRRQTGRDELTGKAIGHGIGMARQLNPPIPGENGVNLCGNETVLG